MYVAEAPLYQVREKAGKQRTAYAYDDEQRDRRIAAFGGSSKVRLQRYKGLGEMNPAQLKETVFALTKDGKNPVLNDRLIRFEVDDVHYLNLALNVLMGNQAARRKSWLFARWEQGTEIADEFRVAGDGNDNGMTGEGGEA
jgi:DNA gyrase/topoisomerase IV subunit B